MEMLQGVWKHHLRPRAAVGYGVKILLPSPPNYVTRSPDGNFVVKPSFQGKGSIDVIGWMEFGDSPGNNLFVHYTTSSKPNSGAMMQYSGVSYLKVK